MATKDVDDVDSKQKHQWAEQHENVLKRWAEIAMSNRWLHSRSYKRMSRMHIAFNLPVIILSTIAGTMNFAQNSFPESVTVSGQDIPVREFVGLLTGAINLCASLITTVATFLKVSERLEAHRSVGIDYGKLGRDISVELALPVSDRRHANAVDFVDNCRKEIERLQSQAPDVSMDILRSFQRRFKKSTFAKPEVLSILPVEIFRNPVDHHELKIKQLAEHESVRAAAAAEFKRQVELTAKKYERKKHKRRKSNVQASNVTSSMNRLMSSISARTQAADAVLADLRNAKASASTDFVLDVDDDSTPTVCTVEDEVADDAGSFVDTEEDDVETGGLGSVLGGALDGDNNVVVDDDDDDDDGGDGNE